MEGIPVGEILIRSRISRRQSAETETELDRLNCTDRTGQCRVIVAALTYYISRRKGG